MFFLDFAISACRFIDFCLEVFLLLESSLASGSGDFTLHQLDLIFGVIEELLLSLEVLVEFVDVGHEVSAGGFATLDLAV